jgi:hypothetical protein
MRELLDLFKKMIQVLRHFEGEFSERMRERAKVLLVGANLSPGRRMVTEALRLMGLHNEPQFQDVLGRVGGQRVTLRHVSNRPSPNRTCDFHQHPAFQFPAAFQFACD